MIPLIDQLINRVLDQSGVKKDKLNGVEVIGAGWRIPRVKQEIEKFVKVSREFVIHFYDMVTSCYGWIVDG